MEVNQNNRSPEPIDHTTDNDKWVLDSSVDYKGRVPLRASTGVWTASLFIIVIEFGERLSYFGLITSLINYMTKIMHQDLKTAAKNVNYWSGVTAIMPLFGGFIADAYLGRFNTVFISSIMYLLGLILLTMSWFIPSLKPCIRDVCEGPRKIHEVVFFIAIYLISIGTGGHKPSLESFGGDQFDDDHPEERKKKMSYFNWWNFGLCCGMIVGTTLIVYVQDHISWGAADIVLTVIMAASLVVFVLGRRFYRYRVPRGSPLTPMLQVLVAAISKRRLSFPSDPNELYEDTKSQKTHGRLLCHTNKLKFLDKAAIIEQSEHPIEKQEQNPWKLSTVTKVEEVKLILNMIPIWLSCLPFGVCVAQNTTFFIKQGGTMNKVISGNLEISSSTLFVLSAFGMIICVTLYETVLVPMLRRKTGNERGMKVLQRIGIGMVFAILAMVIAALVEKKRRSVAIKDHLNGSLSMSVFWLAPQFIILGFGDGFTLVGLQEYFYDEVPDSMRSLGIAFYLGVIGGGSFFSSFLISIVDQITSKTGTSWFGQDLNTGHLDYFYWLLASLTATNMILYVFLAQRYTYKNVQRN